MRPTEQPTPCYGRAPLFDSVDMSAHIEAKALCDTCPVLAACETNLQDTIRAHRFDYSCGPRGTWAGRLMRPNKKAKS